MRDIMSEARATVDLDEPCPADMAIVVCGRAMSLRRIAQAKPTMDNMKRAVDAWRDWECLDGGTLI